MLDLRRRQFITLLACAAASWPLAVRGGRPAYPRHGFWEGGKADEEGGANAMGATPGEQRTPVKMIPERIRDSVAERDHMRPFALTTLVAAALGLSGVMFAWHPVLAD